jgi:hypothetical protein
MTPYTILQTDPYPVYEIDLATLDEAAGISWIMKSFGVVDYVYTFEYQGCVIKHGISVDKNSNFGDRIYRQAGHLEGWKYRLRGPNGNDMRLIDADYFAETGEHLNRLGTKIIVRDLTNMSSPSPADCNLHVKQLERQLIKEYVEKHHRLPIGNIKDEAHIDHKAYVADETFNNIFTFA